jgi:thymidylate synthase
MFNKFTELNHIVDFDENYIYYPVESITIKSANDVDVYNFEVEGDNSYTVNNVIAHNCHTNVQFYVEEDSLGDQHLSCQFYMRSNDFALANNFNVTSYTILTYILALKCNMKPKEIIFTCGDTHVYKTHIEPIKEQLTRNSRPFPVLLVDDSVKYKDFNKITVNDFELCGYYPHKNIKLEMAI